MNHIITLNPVNLCLLDFGRLKTWLKLSFVLVLFLLGFYIYQVNDLTQAGYYIASYEKQIAEFSQESQLLSSSVTDVNSLASLETVLSEMDYEAVGQVHYLRVPGITALAK